MPINEETDEKGGRTNERERQEEDELTHTLSLCYAHNVLQALNQLLDADAVIPLPGTETDDEMAMKLQGKYKERERRNTTTTTRAPHSTLALSPMSPQSPLSPLSPLPVPPQTSTWVD